MFDEPHVYSYHPYESLYKANAPIRLFCNHCEKKGETYNGYGIPEGWRHLLIVSSNALAKVFENHLYFCPECSKQADEFDYDPYQVYEIKRRNKQRV